VDLPETEMEKEHRPIVNVQCGINQTTLPPDRRWIKGETNDF